MKTITVTVDNVTIKGPFANKKTGREFFTHELTASGKRYSVFRNDDTQIESIGDKVNIAYETSINGKYENNLAKKVEILSSGDLPFDDETENTKTTSETTNKESKTKSSTKDETTKKVVSTETTRSTVSVATTSKDISMEVSGLLQAIINKHGLDSSTEERLREALQLKRKIATELEQTGSV